MIGRQVKDRWTRPPSLESKGLKCTIQVRLKPDGRVVANSVKIIESSGNPVFDRSVEQAVYRSEPLPVPAGPLFESFRELTFVFRPSD
ncbi:hypothetical protein CCP4SC76_5590004 [Gammaproteobacteria bacterium]